MSDVSHVFIAVLVAGNIMALAAGLALVMIPKRVVKIFGMRSQHPVSVRRLTKSIERTRDSEKIMLRYPRVLGAALLAGGIFVLVKWMYFVKSLSTAEGGKTLARLFADAGWSAPVWESVWITLLIMVLVGATLAVIVGLLAFTSAKKLKKLTMFANQWVSTRQAAKPISQPYYGLDRLVAARPQTWGVIITLLSVYTLGMIAWFARI